MILGRPPSVVGRWSLVSGGCALGTFTILKIEYEVNRERPGTNDQRLAAASSFHPALQDQHSCQPVHDFPPAFDGHFRIPQYPVGFRRGQAFIPQVNRQFRGFAQVFRKQAHLFGLGPLGTAHPQRQPNHDFCYFIPADDLVEGPEVRALVFSAECLQPLSRDP
jgi:hypothetical protein